MRRHHTLPMIEPLESRIAPAAIAPWVAYNFNSQLISSKTGQTILQFYRASDPTLTGANKAIAATVGFDSDVYFIKVTAGEDVQIETATGAHDIVNVASGTVVAFFTDLNPNNSPSDQVLGNELTGVALGNKVSVGIGDAVNGDIITNYNDLTGAIGSLGGDTTQLLPNIVTSLNVDGNISGAFISGGAVGTFEASGTVNEVLTGNAINTAVNTDYSGTSAPYAYSFAGGGNLITLSPFVPGLGVAGPSLSNVVLGAVNEIALGGGGPGAAGGSLNGLTLVADVFASTITAGAGGAGVVNHPAGGAGGSISNVLINPPTPSPSVPPTNSLLSITAGAGGAGFNKGAGGAGGSVKNVFIDYDFAGVNFPGVTFLQDDVTIQGGMGGAGNVGGAGGALGNINVLTSTPHSTTAVGPEIQLLGGDGGSGAIKGGAGGSIGNSYINDVGNLTGLLPTDSVTNLANDLTPTSPTNTLALIQSGYGGAASTHGAGGAGGSVGSLTLEGFNFDIVTGYGGQGITAGGAGGAINVVTVLGSSGSLPGDDYHVQSLVLTTGYGGAGVDGPGGAGGSVYDLNVNNADFGITGFDGFSITTGYGGAAGKGAGGAGGGVSLVHVTGLDFQTDAHPEGNSGTASIIAGYGGSAPVLGGKGGAGGSISNVIIVDPRLAVSAVTGGAGGSGGVNAATGTGGAGGTVTSVAIRTVEDLYPTYNDVTSPTTGVLLDQNAMFVTNGVAVGDFVENTTNQMTTTVTNVTSNTELSLASDIFAAGDSYVVVVPSTGGGAQPMDLTGVEGDNASIAPSEDTIVDNNANFYAEGVVAGDVVLDLTDGLSATVTATPAAPTVTNPSTVLSVSANISHVGDTYVFTTLGGIAASPTTILSASSNFITEGITPGTQVEDVTATQADGIPIYATVVSVTAHSLTIKNPTTPPSSLANPTIFGTFGDTYTFPALGVANMSGGAGGNGAFNGAGGKGGSVINSSAVVPGTVTFTGGLGGNGGGKTGTGVGGAAGAGGALTGDGAFSSDGSGFFTAGSAGASGAKAGAGGSVSGAVVEVLDAVSLIAGNGTAGGAGGNVTSSGFSGVLQNGAGFNPQEGNVTVQAGAGGSYGASTTYGGAGGSISGITGFVSTGDGVDLIMDMFQAGAGGDGISKAGAGGSVDHVRFFGGGGADVTLYLEGGNAGNATTAKIGAAGGSVTFIGGGADTSSSGTANFSINPLTDFNQIAAGDGGNATKTGGAGGSVSNVFVNAAIGVRMGDPFGFNIAGVDGATATDMGGISAGSGGIGATSGVAGNVSAITADAIASIVAGYSPASTSAVLTAKNLANKVDEIILNGTTALTTAHEFTLSFEGLTTAPVATDASAIQVASALNNLSTISAAGGVSVTEVSGNYVVTFNNDGVQNTIMAVEPAPAFATENSQGTAKTPEVQTVQVLADAQFTLTFDGQTTKPISYTGNPTTDAAAVQSALDGLGGTNPTIPGGVTVVANPPTTMGTATTNPSFTITFGADGAQPLITPSFVLPVANSGSASTQTIETISFPPDVYIDNAQISAANFVGSIVNPQRPNSTTFAYYPIIPPTVANPGFVFGDQPIDGLIAAVNLTAYKNFVPQTYITEDASGNAFVVDNING